MLNPLQARGLKLARRSNTGPSVNAGEKLIGGNIPVFANEQAVMADGSL